MKKELLELTKRLIQIPSISDDIEQLNNIVNFVEQYFSNIDNIFIKKFEFNKKPSIIISNFDWKRADIVLNWHLDVVPPSEKNQFEPYEKDWKLYWRGAWDMKSGDAIMMALMKNLLKSDFKKKKIMLMLTTDEEVWGFDWVGKLVKLWYWGDVVLIPDGWSLKDIVHAEKGIIHLEVKFYWHSCHSSRPWLWENAIDNMIKFYQALRLYIQNYRKLYLTETHWWSSVNLNVVSGGKATNIIPDEVIWKFDIRFTEEFSMDELLTYIHNLVDKYNGQVIGKLTWDILYTDAADLQLQKYYNIAKKIIGEDVNFVKEHWASDGRFFAAKWSKVILHRPTCWNVHWKRERVNIDDLEKIYKCFEKFILD